MLDEAHITAASATTERTGVKDRLTPVGLMYEWADASRRWLGLGLDLVGLRPVETPSRVAAVRRGFALRAYQGVGETGRVETGPVLLIVPAPIKRPYIWDLAPEVSVVRRCRRGGVRVYLMDWDRPGPEDQEWGLAEYADRFIHEALDVVEAESGEPAFVAGHSLGGTQAAVFASLHPRRVRGLILIEAPICFGPEVGALDALVARLPPAGRLTAYLGNPPGTFLSVAATAADARDLVFARSMDWLASVGELQALRTYLRVERWTLDESPLARKLFEQVAEELYRANRFMEGNLTVSGRTADPNQIKAPILSVADRTSRLVPPGAVLPFHEAVSSTDAQVLWRESERGVALQHVGGLVGRWAHKHLWPQILAWIHARRVT